MRQKLIEVFDKNKKRVAVLENAYSTRETQKLNDVSALTFQIPDIDPKARFCQQKNFVRYDHGEMYRILDYTATKESTGNIEYTCEHAITTLADKIMFRDHVVEGARTRGALNYILSRQSDWILGECDFDFQYDYAWTSENLLNALYSVATPFVENYKFVFQTDVYPWRVSLKKLDVEGKPTYYVFAGLNFLRSRKTTKTSELITRLYCDGAGEGVNQVGISKVSPGKLPYIQAPKAITDQYGIIEGRFCDRSYDKAQDLYNAGVALLKKVQVPREEYEIDVADLEGVSSHLYASAEVGDVVFFKKDNYKTYITEKEQNHDVAGDVTIKLANTPEDIAGTLADIANRLRIEATYSQGATQIWGSPMGGDAGPETPLTYPLWIPADARIVNSVKVKIKLSRFRYNSKTTGSGGGSTQTSSTNGGSTRTSSAAGATMANAPAATSGSTLTYTGNAEGEPGGVGTTGTPYGSDSTDEYTGGTAGASRTGVPTSSPLPTDTGSGGAGGGAHTHPMPHYHPVNIEHVHLMNHRHTYNHFHKLGQHQHAHPHTHTVPPHEHAIGNHTHTVTVPDHTHKIDIPNHTHNVEYGIFLSSDSPKSAKITIGGTNALTMGTEIETEITQFLVGSNGEIPRGRFLDISVYPDIFAYVEISVAATGFIQSKQGGTY